MSERERERVCLQTRIIKQSRHERVKECAGVFCLLFVFFCFLPPGCHGATTSSRLDRLTLCNKLEGNRINVTMFRSLLYIVLFI